METLDSEEILANACSIICLPPDPDQVTDEENLNGIYLDEVEPVNVYRKVWLNLKWHETLDISKKKITSIEIQRCLKEKLCT